MDDFRKVFYGVIIAFIVVIVGWVSFVTLSGCGFSLNNCNASVPIVSRTSIPSLVPATLPISTHPVAPTATHFMSLAPTQIALASSTPINLVSSSLTGTPPSGVSGNTASVTSTLVITMAAATPTTASVASSGVPRPSNLGGPGDAINLTGDPNSGAQIFAANCVTCHNAEGKGGIPNPGSDAGSCPALNPINPALKNSDHLTFVTNLDLFIQHGSTPAGPGPINTMPPWGDRNALTQQQIADVIAYLISLNP